MFMNNRIPGAPANIMGDYMHDPRLLHGQQLAESGSSTAPAATPLAALARALQGGLGGLMMSQAKTEATTRTGDYNETLARALKAGSGNGNTFDSSTGSWSAPSGKADPDLLARVLSTNKDTAPMGTQFAMSNMQRASDRQADIASKTVKTLTPDEYKQRTGFDLPPGAIAQMDAYNKITLTEPKQDRAVKTVNTKEGVFVLNDDGTLGRRLGSPVSEKDEGNGGPFRGNALDAQAMNILLDPNADRSSPRYAAAFNHLASPKFDFTTGQMIRPDMSAFQAPAAGAPAAAPAPPQGDPAAAAPAPMPAAPGGGPTVSPIPGYEPKMTENQSAAALYVDRMAGAHEILNKFEGEGTKYLERLKSGVADKTGYNVNSKEYQQFDQAKRDFINAVLRRESGAVIADSEFANGDKQYFPQPGDSPEVIKQKRLNRETAIEGIKRAAGPAYKPPAVRPGAGPDDLKSKYGLE